jgi:hypothetical protein
MPAPPIPTQTCFDRSKTDLKGAGKFGSAIAPTATPIIAGKLSALQYTVEPHSEQK